MLIPAQSPAVLPASSTLEASTFISPSLTTAAHVATPTGIGGSITGNWSSLIGVITAIVGNVLISFALNTQRYAHIRLSSEQEERQRAVDKRRGISRQNSYGATDTEVAEESAKIKRGNGSQVDGAEDRGYRDSDYDVTETDALLSGQRGGEPTDSVGADENNGEDEVKQKSYLKSPYWWAGVIMMTIGEGGNFLAYGFAPASIVSPLGVVALISNCVIAPFLFNEPFRKRDILGVIIAVAGAVTVVLSASGENPKLGPEQIWKYIGTWQFETYFGITVGLIIALMWASRRYGQKSILIDLGLVGLFGGYTALSTKGIASLLSYKLWRLVTFPVSYLLIFILVFTAVMQIKYVNRALQRFEATQVIPTQFVMFTLSVILGSAILYQDFKRTSTDDAMKFFGGCAMTFCGVWLITTARPSSDDDEDVRDPEPPEAIDLVHGDLYQDNDAVPSATRKHSDRPEVTTAQPSSSHSSIHTPSVQVTPAVETPPSSFPSAAWDSPSPAPYISSRATTSSNVVAPPSISDPNLPALDTTNIPPATSYRTPLSQSARPLTPRGASDSSLYTPQTPLAQTERLMAERAEQKARHSIAGALPAPMLFSSPLNSGLSAMVADLRRNGSLRSKSGRVRRQASLISDEERGYPVTPSGAQSRESLGSSTRRNTTSSVGQPDDNGLLRTRTEEAPEGRTVRRGRSMSNSLRGFLKNFGHKKEGEESPRIPPESWARQRSDAGASARSSRSSNSRSEGRER